MKNIIIADKDQNRLARTIAQATGCDLLEVETVHFGDGEIKPVLDDANNQLAGNHAIIVHSTSRPVNDNLIWTLFLCDMLRTANVKKVSAIIPYFGYGRQDSADDGSQGLGYSVMQMFERAGVSELITLDLHAPVLEQAVSSMTVHNIKLDRFIAEFVANQYAQKEVTIVAPDKGATDRAAFIADYLHAPLIRCTKERYGPDHTRLISMDGQCMTEHALIVDDIIDTGSTVLHVIEAIKAANDRCKIDLFAIHAVLSNDAAASLQASSAGRIWVTNSIELPDQKKFEKLAIIDISSALVKGLHEIC